ncbi:peptidase S8/S53 subtilisin kexin sedolisin-like protein [Nocardia nova SH22a]|uniref:Peptidase S8/S53 subtilisin kexin sedolisin-like protein n=1 Tax=Nocardia nova SH22a TaxID=1415166 RepID=W5TI72_9NOCA|nr:S8 family serine peptidase [Nocardia nova]AHH18703.1 peptidase S8/S53 subtilisin kexin sedolisin-like protein [Nocardia nova SH22a]
MRALIQLRPSSDLIAAVADPNVSVAASDVTGELPGFDLDQSYTPLSLPGPAGAAQAVAADSVVVRGEIADAELDATIARLEQSAAVVGVFSDPRIESNTCGGDPAVGTGADVQRLLHNTDLGSAGMDGRAVALAIVDTGINAAHVQKVRGGQVNIDAARSWNPPGVSGTAGQFPVAHGSMCAYDALLSAPQAALLDIPVLLSKKDGGTQMDGLLSDALAGYAHLRTVLTDQPEASRALVVSNSWGSFSPDWDFPVGQPGNYSDNPSHPFNVIVGSLESAGADILFAAGNCGKDCPDGRCAYKDRPIGGANSHPSVLSIGGVDTKGLRVGYSSQGPGRLADRKPDICAYTHFLGSKAFGDTEPDTGTSAACPVAAGLVAAVRTVYPASKVSPAQLRAVLQRTATAQPGGYNYDYGYGVVDAAAVLAELKNTDVRA